MLNSKGQSLVMFVLVIPIFLAIFILVVDLGNMYLARRALDNINYITLDYGLDKENFNMEDANKIINMNDSDIIIDDFKIENDRIYILTEKKYKGIFLGMLNSKINKIESSYVGYILDSKKVIERNK